MELYYVDGYAFETREEYNLALREQKNIRSLKAKIDMQNKDSILVIYKRLANRKLLVTPIGFSFLHELRDTLIQQFQVEETELPMISVPSNRSIQNKTEHNFTNEQLLKDNKVKAGTIRTLKIVIAGLVIIIIGIFMINAANPNTGYINYENKVLNKYSSWEDELKEREKQIKSKEAELGISLEEE